MGFLIAESGWKSKSIHIKDCCVLSISAKWRRLAFSIPRYDQIRFVQSHWNTLAYVKFFVQHDNTHELKVCHKMFDFHEKYFNHRCINSNVCNSKFLWFELAQQDTFMASEIYSSRTRDWKLEEIIAVAVSFQRIRKCPNFLENIKSNDYNKISSYFNFWTETKFYAVRWTRLILANETLSELSWGWGFSAWIVSNFDTTSSFSFCSEQSIQTYRKWKQILSSSCNIILIEINIL